MDPTLCQQIISGRSTPGMTFSQQVWAFITRIPEGRVMTYGQVASALGKPAASRAVGQALNRNPLAPQVPCHRVVGSDGRLVGFAHGLDRKKAMLEAEGVRIHADRVDPACIWRESEATA